jgi:hypothetical protein
MMSEGCETVPYVRVAKGLGSDGLRVTSREEEAGSHGLMRQNLIISAIVEKNDRVTAEDVRKVWLHDMRPETAGTITKSLESQLLAVAKSDIPACQIGRHCGYVALNSFIRSCLPIGLINSGDTANAVTDMFEVGQLYQTSNSRGLQWAAIAGIAIAAATKPRATVESILEAIHIGDPRFTDEDSAVTEIEFSLRRTRECMYGCQLREAFDEIYRDKGNAYPFSSVNKVITKAVCVVQMVKGNPKDAIIASSNFGQDASFISAIAAGISGALSGSNGIPEDWIMRVDDLASEMHAGDSRGLIRNQADNLYRAFQRRLEKMRNFSLEMGQA